MVNIAIYSIHGSYGIGIEWEYNLQTDTVYTMFSEYHVHPTKAPNVFTVDLDITSFSVLKHNVFLHHVSSFSTKSGMFESIPRGAPFKYVAKKKISKSLYSYISKYIYNCLVVLTILKEI